MANFLGSLVVRLGLDAAEFTGGLTKAEYQARQFGMTMGRALGAATAGLAGLGAAAAAAAVAMDRNISAVANFQDLAEKIGDTAVNVASLQRVAATSEVGLEKLAAASVKLSAGLSKTDDEGKGVGLALSAIGLEMDKFRQLGAVDQLEAVAKAMAEFEDGTSKTAVAVALFGKSGAEILPALNDLAEAGARQTRLTQEQILAADDLKKQQAALTADLQAMSQVSSTAAVPALAEMVRVLRELLGLVTQNTSGFSLLGAAANGIAAALNSAVAHVAVAVSGLQDLGRRVGAVAAAFGALGSGNFMGIGVIAAALHDDLKKSNDELVRFQRSLANPPSSGPIGADLQSAAETARLGRKPARKALNFVNTTGAKPGGDTLTEAERYLKSLESQYKTAQQLTAVERVNLEIREGALAQATAAQKAKALELATLTDMTARERDFQKVMKDIEADEERRAKRAADAASEALIRLSDEGRRVFEATRTPVEKLAAEQSRLNDLLAQGAINWDTYARAVFDAQEAFERASETNARALTWAEEAGKGFGEAITGALDAAIMRGENFEQVLKRMVLQMIYAQTIMPSLQRAGGAIGGLFGKGLSAIFGGARADGGPVAAGRTYLVGERGPELFTPGASGAITPNSAMTGGGVNVSYHIDARGADAGVEARLRAVMAQQAEQLRREIVPTVVSAAGRGGAVARALGRA